MLFGLYKVIRIKEFQCDFHWVYSKIDLHAGLWNGRLLTTFIHSPWALRALTIALQKGHIKIM